MRNATPVNSYFTTVDVARMLDCSDALVRYFVRVGQLHAVATTQRGTRLFDPKDVQAFKRQRAERGK